MLLYTGQTEAAVFRLSLDFKKNDDGCTNMIMPNNNTSLSILVGSKVICVFGIGQIWSWSNIKSAYLHEQGSMKQCWQSY